MMNRHFLGTVLGCCLLLAPATQAMAAGGVRVGPALLFPSLTITEIYDDNIALASDGEESDWRTSIAPELRVVMPVRHFFLNAEGGLDFRSYSENTDENSTDWFAGAAVGGEFPGGLSFRLSEKYQATYLATTQEFGQGEDSTLNTLKALVNYSIRDVLRLEVSGALFDRTYDLSHERERGEATVKVALYWKFRPSISALAEVSYADYAYDSTTVQDNTATQAALGLDWDVTAKSAGFAKAGYQWKNYATENQTAGIESADYFIVSAGLRHTFTPRTKLVAEIARSSEESDFSRNPYYLRTSLGAAITQRFTAKIYARAGLSYKSDSYPEETTIGTDTDKRSDSLLDANIGVGFDMTRWLTLELAYGSQVRNSNFDTYDYNDTRVSLSAKAAF